MAWEHLSVTKPHLVYIILGGFTSIFMLVSLFIKEKLYIGEATVATICGTIFSRHAANLINPLSWGNTDLITLEFSRIVLVVQCFAVGVELPKAYMERHWRSVVFLLVPVMTFGWLISSLFIWWMIVPLTWLESLVVAACVTATDPVLASSVVGKGKFAKRVPKHLRDLLSAESGCNDGMAFPFVYLAIYLLRYDLDAAHVTYHWFCYTVLYECIFGAFYGFMVGYIGRHAIKLAERKGIIDRESFLVFYFVLALFCAGSGSLLGTDDLLVGFAAGVGFSNDGWFTEKTEESHVSNVIDLLINLSYFVYFGTVIPWDQFNAPDHGITPWRLVVIALLVLFFRRIPIMLALKPLIPDVRTWREALFAGHFGPIGVGAIFVAILARAELESETTEPLDDLPPPGSKDYDVIYLIWPITTFLVMSSILVHGSSIAVFTLGRRINTLQLTLSFTQDNDKGAGAWMNRLPRISSQSKSMSRTSSFSDVDEKLEVPPGQLPPVGIPKLALRRQKDEDYNMEGSKSSGFGPRRRKRKHRDSANRPGGPVSAGAFGPARRSEPSLSQQESGSETLFDKSGEPSPGNKQLEAGPPNSDDGERRSRSMSPSGREEEAEIEVYDEGDEIIVEDKEGNVIDTLETRHKTDEEKAAMIEGARLKLKKDKSGEYAKHKHEPHAKDEGEEVQADVAAAATGVPPKTMKHRFDQWKGFGRSKTEKNEEAAPEASGRRKPRTEESKESKIKRGAAHAYQFGNTIIVEDEDGEVIKEFTLPVPEGGEPKRNYGQDQYRHAVRRMSTWVGLGKDGQALQKGDVPPATQVEGEDNRGEGETLEQVLTRQMRQGKRQDSDSDGQDDGLRMTISRAHRYGLTGRQKDPEDREGRPIVLQSGRRLSTAEFFKEIQTMGPKKQIQEAEASDAPEAMKREVKLSAKAQKEAAEGPRGFRESTLAGTPAAGMLKTPRFRSSSNPSRPEGDNDYFSQRPQAKRQETADSINTIEEEIPYHDVQSAVVRHGQGRTAADARRQRLSTITSAEDEEDEEEDQDEEGETAAERRRRLAALGIGGGGGDEDSDSDENDEPRRPREAVQEPGHMEAASASSRGLRVQWGGERGRERANSKGDKDKPEHTGRKVRGMFKHRS